MVAKEKGMLLSWKKTQRPRNKKYQKTRKLPQLVKQREEQEKENLANFR